MEVVLCEQIDLENIGMSLNAPNDSYLNDNILYKGFVNHNSSVWIHKNRETEDQSKIVSKEILIQQYKNDILSVVRNDVFEDAIRTKSEDYIIENFSESTSEYLKQALMQLYLDNVSNAHILTGLLMMIGSISYESIAPEGQIMAMGLLQNKDISIRDRAIQTFERWNSRKGIPVLRSLRCDRKWLQRYVDKVIMYIERDGID